MIQIQILIDIDEEDYNIVKKQVADGITNLLKICIANGTPIFDNATNGDVMGIIFPKIGLYDEWYDEPYQKGGK